MKIVNYTTTKIVLSDYEAKTLREAIEILCDIYNQAPEDTEFEKSAKEARDNLDNLLDEAAPNSELDTVMCWTVEEYNETEE